MKCHTFGWLCCVFNSFLATSVNFLICEISVLRCFFCISINKFICGHDFCISIFQCWPSFELEITVFHLFSIAASTASSLHVVNLQAAVTPAVCVIISS